MGLERLKEYNLSVNLLLWLAKIHTEKEHVSKHVKRERLLVQASKTNRILKSEIPKRLRELSILPIKTDLETHRNAFQSIYKIAQKESLTSYDAAYLELAVRRDLPLATKDKALRKAAKKLSVNLVG